MSKYRIRISGEVVTPKEAVALQRRWATRVVEERRFGRVRTVGGVDVSVRDDVARAAVVVLRYPSFETVAAAVASRRVEFPYVPGLLALREVPTILDAFGLLDERPDLLLVDGHGRAHPRRFGLACHLGVELDLPAIGCGKTLFVGEHREPRTRKGSRAALRHKGEVIGSAVRTRDGVKPLYVSVGHRIDLRTAVSWVLRCCPRFRLPEPIRAAHRTAGSGSPGPPRRRSARR